MKVRIFFLSKNIFMKVRIILIFLHLKNQASGIFKYIYNCFYPQEFLIAKKIDISLNEPIVYGFI